MNNDLEREVQKMIAEGVSEEEIGIFIQNRTKHQHSELRDANKNSIDSQSIDKQSMDKIESEFEKLSTSNKEKNLSELLPFAFDITLIIISGSLINSYTVAKDVDYYDHVTISFTILFCIIILAKWHWNYKGLKTGTTIKNFHFYLLLFLALLFGLFYVSLLAD